MVGGVRPAKRLEGSQFESLLDVRGCYKLDSEYNLDGSMSLVTKLAMKPRNLWKFLNSDEFAQSNLISCHTKHGSATAFSKPKML